MMNRNNHYIYFVSTLCTLLHFGLFEVVHFVHAALTPPGGKSPEEKQNHRSTANDHQFEMMFEQMCGFLRMQMSLGQERV